MSRHPERPLEALKDRARQFAEAAERVASLGKEKKEDTVAAISAHHPSDRRDRLQPAPYQRTENQPRKGDRRIEARKETEGNAPAEKEHTTNICWRCTAEVPKGKYCQCADRPKCKKCGGLHKTQFHAAAKEKYLQTCAYYGTKPHSKYDASASQNQGWWEEECEKKNKPRERRGRDRTPPR